MSDLHLEVGKHYATFTFPATAQYLVLAGDIGCLDDYDDYLAFLARQTARYARVFLVLGNHEFHTHRTFASGLALARQLERDPRLHGRLSLLHRSRVEIEDGAITLLGCTLWSSIPETAKAAVQARVKDYSMIRDWSVDLHNAAHDADLDWLRRELRALDPANKVVVVVTHHAPIIHGTSKPAYVDSPWTSAFATNVLLSGDWSSVDYWVHGHTHHSTDLDVGSTKVVSNQLGYLLSRPVGQTQENTPTNRHEFNPGRVICLPTK